MNHKWIVAWVGILLSISGVIGQDDCPLLVERALQAANDNCTDLDRNTACYAYNQVQATFLEDVDETFFTHPADRADLTYLDTIQTAPLDEANDLWGIAMMSVQANVPNTLPGQAVIFMLMGDVVVENTVDPDTAFTPSDPVAITTLAASSNIRLSPIETGYVLGTAPINSTFDADGISENGEWVRIIFEDQPAWIYRNLINSENSLDELPVISDQNRTPMQAFYFSTGTGQSTCNEAPDSLMIQGPNSLEVQINANGVDINIGSTIVLNSTGANQISITAINGYADVGNVRVPGGFTIDAFTDEQGTIQLETLSGLRPMADEQIGSLESLEKIDGDIINYQVNVMDRAEIETVQRDLENGQLRENIRNRCVTAGLTAEQCRNFVGSDTNQGTIVERCMNSGLSEQQCRNAIGGNDSESDVNSPIELNAIGERCRQAGFQTLEDCRTAYSGESDDRIQICTALGHNSSQGCRNAFPEDSVDNILSCVSRGFSTKAACDVADSGDTGDNNNSDDEVTEQNACQRRGLTPAECRRARMYRECRNRGRTEAECRAATSGRN